MSNITKFVPLHLSPTDFVALEANKCPKIATINKDGAEKRLKDSIKNAFIIMAHGYETAQLIIFTDCLWDELKKNQSMFSLEEIHLALEFGAMGKLTDLTKIPQPVVSLSNFLLFIRLYNKQIRQEALAKDQAEKDKQEKFISDQERAKKIEAFNNEILGVYNSYCENFEMPELSAGLKATYCRHLYSKNIVELSVEQEAEIFAKAKKEAPAEEINLIPLNDVDRIFNNKKKSAQIQEIAESIALEYLFTEYLKSSINLQEKLNENL